MATAVATYGYIHAKLRTRIGQITQNPIVDSVIDAPSIEEVMRILEESSLSPVAEAWKESGDIRMGELALLRQEVLLLRSIQQQLPPAIQPFIRSLLRRYEVQQIKELTRHWFHTHSSQDDLKESLGYIFRDTIIHTIPVEALMQSETLQNFATLLPKEYGSIVEREIPRIESDNSLFSLEQELDIYYYKQLLHGVSTLPKKDRVLAERRVLGEIDMVNIEGMYRYSKLYNLSLEQCIEQLIPFGRVYKQRSQIGSNDDSQALLHRLIEGYLPHLTDEDFSSFQGDSLMWEYLLRDVNKLLSGYPFSIAIIIGYANLKRWENQRMIKIIHAKHYGLSPSAIREML